MNVIHTTRLVMMIAAAGIPLAVQARPAHDGSAAANAGPETHADHGGADARKGRGKTFGESVAGGLQSGAGAQAQGASAAGDGQGASPSPQAEQDVLKTRHDTVKNSIGNVR